MSRHQFSGPGKWISINFGPLAKIDIAGIMKTAIDKCRRSQNPLGMEPGRHTAILEPQAIADLYGYGFNHPDEYWRIVSDPARTGLAVQLLTREDPPPLSDVVRACAGLAQTA